MDKDSMVYVGFHVSKAKRAVAIAESGRTDEVRNFGEIEATPAAVERFGRKLEKKHGRLHVCYEAGALPPNALRGSSVTSRTSSRIGRRSWPCRPIRRCAASP